MAKLEIINDEVAFLKESFVASGLPKRLGLPTKVGELSKNDIIRGLKLGKALPGTGHNNFLKGIIVQFDMKYSELMAPQMLRYNFIDIVSSQSKMHKITSKALTMDDFGDHVFPETIDRLNELIVKYNKSTCDTTRALMEEAIQNNLPLSYYKWWRVSTNYLQLVTIYRQRKNHKLKDWHIFVGFIKNLPYMNEILKLKDHELRLAVNNDICRDD